MVNSIRASLALCGVSLLHAASESAVREAFTRATGEIHLPPGITVLSRPLDVSATAQDLIISGTATTVLKAGAKFNGRALIHLHGGTRISLHHFAMQGHRSGLAEVSGIAPSDQPFHQFYANNGIVAEGVTDLVIESVTLRGIANFPVLVSHSRNVRIRRVNLTDCGSLNAKGRNNTSGGILLEEGTRNFEVTNCRLLRVRGNGIWTHSLYTSPRNEDGRIAENSIQYTARDAIQIGHATRIRVTSNSGKFIGYPSAEVDVENEGWPVAIDTAGNVDQSSYALNTFEELNGKCIDLDGFHHGEVRRNRCVNSKPAAQYPYGHYGIVMNNSNPDMESEKITIIDNELEGMKFGGIFVIGTGHRIEKNRMRNLNTAGCPETQGKIACVYDIQQPDLLQSGIYLGLFVDPKRRSPARNNVIIDNLIMGHGMKTRCLVYAPGLSPEGNEVARNICLNPPVKKPEAKLRPATLRRIPALGVARIARGFRLTPLRDLMLSCRKQFLPLSVLSDDAEPHFFTAPFCADHRVCPGYFWHLYRHAKSRRRCWPGGIARHRPQTGRSDAGCDCGAKPREAVAGDQSSSQRRTAEV